MKFIDPHVVEYAIQKSTVPSANCKTIEDFTRKNIPMSQMLIGQLEASLLGLLIRMAHAKRVLEIGTYTGYSALAMAENLPQDGELITLDIDAENAAIAQRFWAESSHGSKITQYIGPALETLKSLEGSFDFVFIDADKPNYLNYVKTLLPRLSSGALLVLDNVLWSGRVLDYEEQDAATVGLRQVNDFIQKEPSLYKTFLPIRDGLYVAQKL